MNLLARPRVEQIHDRMRSLGLPTPVLSDLELLAAVRALMPRRRLTFAEGLVVAERQANRLRELLGASETPRLGISSLSRLSFLTFTNRDGFPTSGMAVSGSHGWTIVIRGDEAKVRRRFTAAHETKHVIDDEHMTALQGASLYRATRLYTADEVAERMADHFAGALLVPKRLVRRDWADGIQSVDALAERYEVSNRAMSIRLAQLGLVPPAARRRPLIASKPEATR